MPSIELFHVSELAYTPGEVLPPLGGPSRFQEMQGTLGNAWVESALEASRPPTCVSRIGAYFACASVADCAAFATAEPRFNQPGKIAHYYRVRTNQCTRVPMALVGIASQHGEQGFFLPEIIGEYWQPRQRWEYLEFLCESMEVVEEVNRPDVMDLAEAKGAFYADRNKAKGLWPV